MLYVGDTNMNSFGLCLSNVDPQPREEWNVNQNFADPSKSYFNKNMYGVEEEQRKRLLSRLRKDELEFWTQSGAGHSWWDGYALE